LRCCFFAGFNLRANIQHSIFNIDGDPMILPFSVRLSPLAAATFCFVQGLATAQEAPAPTLKPVTVSAGMDDSYSPAASSTATKGSAPLRDIPQAVNVVPEQLLRDQGARSMQDALRNVPGVVFSSGDGQRDQVVIRGFTAISDQFLDGVRDDALYFRDLSNIQTVEVLKGPAAVLYGRGSSGGLINRVTKKPKFNETAGEITLGAGTYGYQRTTADLNAAVSDTVAFRLNAALEDSGSYRDQQFTQRHSIAPSLAFKFSPDTDLLLQYTHARDKRLTDFGIPSLNGKPAPVPASTYYGSVKAERDDTTTSQMQTLSATFNHRFNDAWSVRNTSRAYSYELDRYNTPPSGITNPVDMTVGRTRAFILRDETGVFNQTDFTYKTDLGGIKQEWLMGLELGQQNRRSESVSGGLVDRVSILNPASSGAPPAIAAASYAADGSIPSHTVQDVAGVYVQNQLTLTPHWKALAGVRYDSFKQSTSFDRKLAPLSRTDTALSPRAGLVWQPSDTQSYYLSVSKSFQPSGEAFALAASNAANEAEITQNREIGTKLDFLNGAFNVTAALFNLERSNIKNSDPANPAVQINVGKQRTNGLELTANGKLPGHWDVSAGYAFLAGRMVESVARAGSAQLPVVSVPALGKEPALTARHSGFLWGMKNLGEFGSGNISLGGGLNYMGERFASLTNLVTLPAYLTADLAGSYKTKGYDIDVNLKNITNKEHIISSHGASDNLILPGPPRELQVTLRVKF
jgi:catecholate siderophore receptor